MDSLPYGPGHTPAPVPAPRRRAALTEGPVGPLLFNTTLPLALALAAMFAVQLAETWLVGLLGREALAALGFAAPIAMTATSFGIGLGAGASAVVARGLGAGDRSVERLSAHALWLAAGTAAAVAVPGWLLAPALLRALGAEGEVHALAQAYLRAWFPGAVPLVTGIVALSLTRAAGDTRFQGAALAGAGAFAFLLDWPLAFGVPAMVPGLGVPGLAVAAAVSWSAMLALALRRLRSLGLLDRLATAPCGGFAASARRVLRVGLPAAATNAIIPVGTTLFTAMLAAHGAVAVAGFSIGSRVEALAMVAFFALSAVANPFAAQNAGAGRMERVQAGMRASLLFCAAAGAATGLLLWLFGPQVARLFTDDPAVVASTALYLSLMPWGFGAVGAIAVANAAFNGLERPLPALALSLARTLAVGVPLAWLGGRLAGEAGTLLGILLTNLAVGLAAGLWVLRATAPAGAAMLPPTRTEARRHAA
ncbi:MATE family efflux transporter [Craurococcus roseus]|uniref:MATE family efflux transporter n=1 Tax=Craurococcus roseus TaxID=77585 RepID=A0ABN1F6J7_9PROT